MLKLSPEILLYGEMIAFVNLSLFIVSLDHASPPQPTCRILVDIFLSYYFVQVFLYYVTSLSVVEGQIHRIQSEM